MQPRIRELAIALASLAVVCGGPGSKPAAATIPLGQPSATVSMRVEPNAVVVLDARCSDCSLRHPQLHFPRFGNTPSKEAVEGTCVWQKLETTEVKLYCAHRGGEQDRTGYVVAELGTTGETSPSAQLVVSTKVEMQPRNKPRRRLLDATDFVQVKDCATFCIVPTKVREGNKTLPNPDFNGAKENVKTVKDARACYLIPTASDRDRTHGSVLECHVPYHLSGPIFVGLHANVEVECRSRPAGVLSPHPRARSNGCD